MRAMRTGPTHRLRARTGGAIACLAAFALLAPPAAGGATLTTDAHCYAQGAPLRLSASELTPGAPLTVALNGQPLRYRDGSSPAADPDGGFTSSFATPALAPGTPERRHLLTVEDGESRARARFTVTRPPGADFAPARGNPRRLRARFTAWGFALERGRNARLWLHWIDPDGRWRKSAALGVTTGHCGRLRTPRRRVFPFVAEPGRWTLAIDARRRYRPEYGGPRATIAVQVRPLSL